MRTNLEAADEVVRQLRLRDIGGIIVIDFIDMEDQFHRAELMQTVQRGLERDRTKTRVTEMSRLGLVEMTRKNVTDGLYGILTEPCPCCSGEGRVLSDTTRRIAVERTDARDSASGAVARRHTCSGFNPETYELVMAPGQNVVAIAARPRQASRWPSCPDRGCRRRPRSRVLIEGKRRRAHNAVSEQR